jgi:glycerol-3-phosphate dehydrogenase subunit C
MSGEKRVAYFAGCVVNHVDPEVGKSTIQVLRKQGLRPMLLDEKCCGIPQLAVGNLRQFLKHAEFNVRSMVEADCDIVTACTSCAMAVKHDYPKYLETEGAEKVSKRIFDVMEYLAILEAGRALDTDLHPVNLSLVYHAPCHLKVMGEELVDRRLKLLRSIPGLSVTQIQRGCCGMGGTFGTKRSNYSMSMRIGQPLFEGIAELTPDLVATDCPGCQLQIQQGTGLTVIHPIQIIGESFGLRAHLDTHARVARGKG